MKRFIFLYELLFLLLFSVLMMQRGAAIFFHIPTGAVIRAAETEETDIETGTEHDAADDAADGVSLQNAEIQTIDGTPDTETPEDPGSEADIDYMAQMMAAVMQGDTASGLAAQECRERKIQQWSLGYPPIAFTDLQLLAKLIYAEAGCSWLDRQWKMAVGEVVLNRVASPEFPDTIYDVLTQAGQYYGPNSAYFNRLLPDYDSVDAARRLLEGERVLDNRAVVFQANARQGSGVYLELRDALLGSTYFCFSYHMELYQS